MTEFYSEPKFKVMITRFLPNNGSVVQQERTILLLGAHYCFASIVEVLVETILDMTARDVVVSSTGFKVISTENILNCIKSNEDLDIVFSSYLKNFDANINYENIVNINLS